MSASVMSSPAHLERRDLAVISSTSTHAGFEHDHVRDRPVSRSAVAHRNASPFIVADDDLFHGLDPARCRPPAAGCASTATARRRRTRPAGRAASSTGSSVQVDRAEHRRHPVDASRPGRRPRTPVRGRPLDRPPRPRLHRRRHGRVITGDRRRVHDVGVAEPLRRGRADRRPAAAVARSDWRAMTADRRRGCVAGR